MKRLYSGTRDLHLYVGLFLSPFLLLFAISTFVFIHRRPATASPAGAPRTAAVEISGEPGSIEQARAILRQLGVTGEIDYIRHNAKAQKLFIPVGKPGLTTKVDVDLRTRQVTVETQEHGPGAALTYLHRMPGPHNVRLRGNWTYLRWWSVVTDAAVYGTLLLTASGLYLWWMLRAERRTGWVMLGAGASTVAVLIAALCAT